MAEVEVAKTGIDNNAEEDDTQARRISLHIHNQFH
jgi:hypothetical protein